MTTNVFKEESLFWLVFKKLIVSFIFSLCITFVVSLPFGYQYMIVRTGSMEPTLHRRTMAILSPTKFEDIEIGDIVTFKSGGAGTMYFTHRVHGFTENGNLITAGDANIDTETKEIILDTSTVPKDRYVGRVVGNIYPIGIIIMFLKEHVMASGIILIAGFVIYILLIDDEEDSVY